MANWSWMPLGVVSGMGSGNGIGVLDWVHVPQKDGRF